MATPAENTDSMDPSRRAVTTLTRIPNTPSLKATHLDDDVEKVGEGDGDDIRPHQRGHLYTVPRAVTIQDDGGQSPTKERDLRRFNSISMNGSRHIDGPSRIVGEFR